MPDPITFCRLSAIPPPDHHMDGDPEILGTLIRLLEEAMAADQQITLATYSCVIRRLSTIAPQCINGRHRYQLAALHASWRKAKNLLWRVNDRSQERLWKKLMVHVLSVFGSRYRHLTDDIKSYYGLP